MHRILSSETEEMITEIEALPTKYEMASVRKSKIIKKRMYCDQKCEFCAQCIISNLIIGYNNKLRKLSKLINSAREKALIEVSYSGYI